MKKILSFIFALFLFTSCSFDEATFQFSDGTSVVVDKDDLNDYHVGQELWIYKNYISMSDWEVLDDFTIEMQRFTPTRDTSFIFQSEGGSYRRDIRLGKIIKLDN